VIITCRGKPLKICYRFFLRIDILILKKKLIKSQSLKTCVATRLKDTIKSQLYKIIALFGKQARTCRVNE